MNSFNLLHPINDEFLIEFTDFGIVTEISAEQFIKAASNIISTVSGIEIAFKAAQSLNTEKSIYFNPSGSTTDVRVCCENIAGGNVCNCERDEGRPLVTVLQEMVTNQCMLLCLRDKVVSDTPKGDGNRQVTVQEMTARELLMKHRKLFRRCQNRVFSVRPGINPEGTCLRSGWHPVQR